MQNEQLLLKKRFAELAATAERDGYFTFTDFLGLAEQSSFREILGELNARFTAFGGAPGCERLMIRFGSPEELGYEEPFPIRVIKISPKSEKFSEKLIHRDYLGSLLSLGIDRRLLGDIALIGLDAYLFATEGICDYIISSLNKIKHTDVKCEFSESVPSEELFKTERMRVQATAERVDSLVSKVFHLSREQAQRLFARRLIFIGGKLTEKHSVLLKPNDVVSVRGYGRFVYRGYESLSKKGKLNIDIDVYI